MTALLLALVACAGLPVGTPAPNFSARNQNDKIIHLSDYRGKPVLLYFYPKDFTPGCTQEACTIRDAFAQFKKAGAVVLGVSRQDVKSHRAFHKRYHLPFDLLADPDGKIAKLYGIQSYAIIGYFKRESVLIGADGKVLRFFDDVNPAEHAAEVLKVLKAAQK